MTVIDWVREIILVVLLGWVLEMLVPTDAFKRYVRMVIGLFVLVAVIQPAVAFLEHPKLPTVSAASPGQSVQTLIQQGLNVRKQEEGAAIQVYQQKVGAQAAAIALTVTGVRSAKGTATVDQKTSDPAFGEVTSVRVAVTPETPAKGGGLPKGLKGVVQDAVARGLALSPGAVTVREKGGS